MSSLSNPVTVSDRNEKTLLLTSLAQWLLRELERQVGVWLITTLYGKHDNGWVTWEGNGADRSQSRTALEKYKHKSSRLQSVAPQSGWNPCSRPVESLNVSILSGDSLINVALYIVQRIKNQSQPTLIVSPCVLPKLCEVFIKFPEAQSPREENSLRSSCCTASLSLISTLLKAPIVFQKSCMRLILLEPFLLT